jgi:hypothetical protein
MGIMDDLHSVRLNPLCHPVTGRVTVEIPIGASDSDRSRHIRLPGQSQ